MATVDSERRFRDLVLVHGLSGSSRWWQHAAAALGADRAVHAIDLVGFGARRREGPFHLDRAPAEVAREIESYGAGAVDLVGHSMGGVVAARVAIERPDLVHALVLVSAPAIPFPWGIGRHALNLARALPTLVPRFVPVLAADVIRAGPRTVTSAARQLLSGTAAPDLERITAPTLVVWGSRDPIVPPVIERRVAARVPHGRYAEIPGAGHVPMWERPAEFVEAVRAFLAASEAAP